MFALFNKPAFTALSAIALVAALPLNAHAHRTWLLPSSTLVESKDPWVTIDAAVSENLFDLDAVGMKLDGLSVTGPDGANVKPENQFFGKLRNSFDLKLAKPGTYKVSVVAESLMVSYKLKGEAKRWRGTEQEFKTDMPAGAEDLKIMRMHGRQETFVSAGKVDTKVFSTSGKGLELEPITHPNDLRTGDPAKMRLLFNGKPAANLSLSLIPGGVRYRGLLGEIRLVADAKGEVSLTLPAAGMYWLSATHSQQATPVEGKSAGALEKAETKFSYSATLEVLPQ
ncbi:MAG: DUF4198 domain-containing protein [Pseudomonadota bacterium]